MRNAVLRGTTSTGQAFALLSTDSRTTRSQAVDVPGRLVLPVRCTYPLLQECYSSADSGASHELVSQAPQLPSKDTAPRSCWRPSTWSTSHEWSACCNRQAFVTYSCHRTFNGKRASYYFLLLGSTSTINAAAVRAEEAEASLPYASLLIPYAYP